MAISFSFQQLIPLFSLLFVTVAASFHHHHLSYTIRDDACTNTSCGQGKCILDLGGLLFHCDCDPGWKAIQIGPLTYPSCIVPNCTMNFTCGSGAGAPPPPPPLLPQLNFSSPCNLVWCADGNCVVNGTEHYCQCNDGAANFLDNPAFLCLEQCYYGADCHHVKVGQHPPPSPPPTSGSPPKGPSEASNCWRSTWPKLIIAFLTTTTFLTWV